MTTMAIPISVLEPVIAETEKAQADTKTVVSESGAAVANFSLVVRLAAKTLGLRHRFANLAKKQGDLITDLAGRDYANAELSVLSKLASDIDSLVADERELLEDANSLGAPIRVWWGESLSILASQVEHLDSIAESLHAAADPESTALMAISCEWMATADEYATR